MKEMEEIIKLLDCEMIKSAKDFYYESIKSYISKINKFDEYKDLRFVEMLKHLSESKLLDEKAAEIFIAEFKTKKAIMEESYWSFDVGIEAVEFFGKHFNRTCADYLKLRSSYWKNNRIKSIEVLRKFRKLFQSNIQDLDYKNAIDAHNSCCEESDKIIVDSETDSPEPKKMRTQN